MPITIRDIAKQVNLSHTTVSRVLNNRDAIHIPEATRERVVAAAREMGYRPNLNARALVTGRANLVALRVYRMNAPFAMEIARHMQSLAWQDGYEVLVHEFSGSDTNLRSMVDGVMLLDRIFPNQEAAPHLEEATPHVALGSFYTETIDCVGVNLYDASRDAMRLLMDSERQRIAFIGRRDAFVDRVDGRINAYLDAMKEADRPQELVHTPDSTRTYAHRAILEYADQYGFPDAVFCENDELAMGCYRALRERGLRVSEDVAVIGCDDIEEGQFLSPPLTTISQPTGELCRLGWEFLKQRIQNRSQDRQQVTLDAQLVLRESH